MRSPSLLLVVLLVPVLPSPVVADSEDSDPAEIAGGLTLAAGALALDAYLKGSDQPSVVALLAGPTVNALGWTGLTVAALSYLGADEDTKFEYAGVMGAMTEVAIASTGPSLFMASLFRTQLSSSVVLPPSAIGTANWMLVPAPVALAAVVDCVTGGKSARMAAVPLQLYLAGTLMERIYSQEPSLPCPVISLAEWLIEGKNIEYETSSFEEFIRFLLAFFYSTYGSIVVCALSDVMSAVITGASMVFPEPFREIGRNVLDIIRWIGTVELEIVDLFGGMSGMRVMSVIGPIPV